MARSIIGLVAFSMVIFLLITTAHSKKRHPFRRYYSSFRPYAPIFARARAVWHPPPSGLRYRQLGEFENMPQLRPGIRRRKFIVQPNAIRKRILRDAPCVVPRESPKVMVVVKEAMRLLNTQRPKMAIKSIGTSTIRTCRKCGAGGRCRYDHTKIRSTVTFAPSCASKNCNCGFEIGGAEKTCTVSGTTKYGIAASNVTWECEVSKASRKEKLRPLPGTRIRMKIVEPNSGSELTTKKSLVLRPTKLPKFRTDDDEGLVTTWSPSRGDRNFDPELDSNTAYGPDFRPAPILTKKKTTNGELLQ